jgi:putative ABC transport system substrate-binding protein
MINGNRNWRRWLAGASLALAAGAAGAQSVAVMSYVEHPALDAFRDGVAQALAEAGYGKDNKNFKWQFQSAQGNNAVAAQIARKFVGDKPDVIVAIATPAAQAVVAATKTIPVVYGAITDPVGAQLVPSLEASGTNVTGVSDALPIAEQIALIKQVVPAAKNVGVVYNPGEANSVAVLEQLRAQLPGAGLNLAEAAAPRTLDVGAAARSLIGRVDVIYTSTDNNVVAAYEALVKEGNAADIPLIAADVDSVKRGAVAALGQKYREMGVEAGRIVVRILKGEKPGAIPSMLGHDLELYLNRSAARAQGVQLSEALLGKAAVVLP